MDEVYVDITKTNKWISKYFNKQYVSIDELLACIEDLDSVKTTLDEEIKELSKTDEEKEEDYIWYKVDEQIDEERLGLNNVRRDE